MCAHRCHFRGFSPSGCEAVINTDLRANLFADSAGKVTQSPNAMLKVYSPCETGRNRVSGIYRGVLSFNRVYWSCKLWYIT